MASQEVRALILLRRRDIRGGAFRLMWGALFGVLALLAVISCIRSQPGLELGTATAAAAPGSPSERAAVVLSNAEPALYQPDDPRPVCELIAVECEDIEDDARPDPIATLVAGHLAPLPALAGALVGLRSLLRVAQPPGSTALPRGPPATA